jgi:ribosome-associated toxin RatA of RatAB toxin-antitoxin module
MREVVRSVLIGRPAEIVWGLVDDIERYPEFVPGCVGARVQSRTVEEVVATLEVRKGPLNMAFTTRNRLAAPHALDMELVDGPFERLSGGWRILPLSADGCRATLTLGFAFANPVTALVLEPIFERILADLVDAFVQRARRPDGVV